MSAMSANDKEMRMIIPVWSSHLLIYSIDCKCCNIVSFVFVIRV